MNPPLYVKLESGLWLNLSKIVAIHPRQPNGSIRVQPPNGPLVVISPVTDNDVQNIDAAAETCKMLVMLQQLSERDPIPYTRDSGSNTIVTKTFPEPPPATRPKKKKPKKKRSRKPVTA